MSGDNAADDELHQHEASRRNLLCGALLWASGIYYGSGSASAYTVEQVKPDEQETYAVAQNGKGHLRVLWVGSGVFDVGCQSVGPKNARRIDCRAASGVFKNLFLPGNEVVAMDLLRPNANDLRAATSYAAEHGYRLRFEQGDATQLRFDDGAFDVVVCSMFLCQDFDPEVVVAEIRRVLKPGGRFGFYEHVEDIDSVIVGKVFGEGSVIRVQANPERSNVIAGVVRKA
jgi:SAM-dependent methyltransferase